MYEKKRQSSGKRVGKDWRSRQAKMDEQRDKDQRGEYLAKDR